MDFDELKDFIENKMIMQHIYQPVMLKTLLKSGNRASIRKIAKSFLELDESQIDYYKVITKQKPGKVLKKHNIVSEISGEYILNVPGLTEDQRNKLILLCEQKISKYIKTKGGDRKLWLYRMKSSAYVPGTIRYEILKRAKGKCELCGISNKVKALQVDHVIPRNKGGKSLLENYQALCYTCNSQQMDKDNTDFREWNTIYNNKREKNCPFCNMDISSSKIIINKYDTAIAFEDRYPVVLNHMLVTPLRHVSSFFELSLFEKRWCFLLIDEIRKMLQER